MKIKYALIVAFVLTALACGQEPAAGPTQDVQTPTPAPLPTSHPVAHSPTPVALHDLKAVELGSDYWPTDLSGERSVGIGRDGEIYLANVRTGEMRQLTNDGYRKRRPVISGDIVAWTDQSRQIETHDNNSRTARGFADDIFVLDLNTGETRRITEVPAKRSGLNISGNRLVWLDNRNEFDEHYTHQDIYAYDLEADEEIAVAVAPGAQHWVAIEGDRVVWADNRNSAILGTDRSGCFECPDNRFDIYLYDFTTGDELVLDESGANNTMPDIYGNRVVWRDFDDEGRTAIRLYDLDTGEKRTLASPSLSGVDRPLVSGDYVVWTVGWPCDVFDTQSIDGSTGAFAHDLRTDEVKRLSNYVEPSISLDGTVVVIHEACQVGGRVYAVFLGTDADTGESAPPSPSSADATDVEVVYASRERQPPSLMPGDYDPLWGDIDADTPIIDRLLRGIVGGTPVETDEELIRNSERSLTISVRFSDGTTWSVREVRRCELTSDGSMTNCLYVPNHWQLLHSNEIIVSTGLTDWFERVEEYMPRVRDFEVPDPIILGEEITISGAGYHEGDTVELNVNFSDESVLLLDEVALNHGAYRWEGKIPGTAPSGLAKVTMKVLEGQDVVWGPIRESVTIAAPTGEKTGTALPDGVTWILNSLDGRPLVEETFINLELDGDNLWGWDGCNGFASQPGDGTVIAQADGTFSTPKEIVGTLRGCPSPEVILEDQADAYMSALMEAERFRVAGDRLELFDAIGAVRLVFVEQRPLPGFPVELVGTEWRLLPEGDAEDAGPATLVFLNDRLVAGSTACRDYVAAYSRLEGDLDFASSSRIGSRESCSRDSRRSETTFIGILTSGDEYSVVEAAGTGRLNIRTSLGKMLVFEPLPPAVEEIVGKEWSLRAFVPLHFVDQLPGGPEVWSLRDVEEVIPGTDVTVSFDEDGLEGSSGCNSYAVPVRREGGSITVDVDSFTHTTNLCEGLDGLMDQEERYLDLLPRLTQYGTYSDGLFFETDDDVFLLFRAK